MSGIFHSFEDPTFQRFTLRILARRLRDADHVSAPYTTARVDPDRLISHGVADNYRAEDTGGMAPVPSTPQ